MAMSPQERGRLGAQKRWSEDAQPQREGEMPRYVIKAACYIDDVLMDPAAQPKDENGDPKPLYYETDTEYPAWYMEPQNEAAMAMCAKNPSKYGGDPVTSMARLPSDVVR